MRNPSQKPTPQGRQQYQRQKHWKVGESGADSSPTPCEETIVDPDLLHTVSLARPTPSLSIANMLLLRTPDRAPIPMGSTTPVPVPLKKPKEMCRNFGIGYSSAQGPDVRAAKPGTLWSCFGVYKKRASSILYPYVFVAGTTNTSVFTRPSDLAEILTKCRRLRGNAS